MQRGNIDLMPVQTPPQPRQLHHRRHGRAALRPIEAILQRVQPQVRRRRQRHALDLPAHVRRADRRFGRREPGRLQPGGQPRGQHMAVGRRPVVVFPRPDIATRPVEMHVQQAGHRLIAQQPGQSGEIRVGHPRPVVALRMRGIISQGHHRHLAIPQTDHRSIRVDHPLSLGPQVRILARRIADRPHFAVRAENAAVRRHLVHLRLPVPDVTDRPRPRQRHPHRPRHATHHRFGDLTIEHRRRQRIIIENRRTGKIAQRRVMLVYRMHRHPLPGRAGRLGQRIPERIMPLVGNADPVD